MITHVLHVEILHAPRQKSLVGNVVTLFEREKVMAGAFVDLIIAIALIANSSFALPASNGSKLTSRGNDEKGSLPSDDNRIG